MTDGKPPESIPSEWLIKAGQRQSSPLAKGDNLFFSVTMRFCPPIRGFAPEQRPAAARLFWSAFGSKLNKLMGPERRALALIEAVVDPDFCLSVSSPDGALLGLAGFKTADGALVGGGWNDLRRVYGVMGAAWRAPLLSVLERRVEPAVLLMDGIAVAPEARGLGIGSHLLEAVVAEAAAQGKRAVRLDVIDTNPRARALYERTGFIAQGTEDAFPFRWLFGFKSATRMERVV